MKKYKATITEVFEFTFESNAITVPDIKTEAVDEWNKKIDIGSESSHFQETHIDIQEE